MVRSPEKMFRMRFQSTEAHLRPWWSNLEANNVVADAIRDAAGRDSKHNRICARLEQGCVKVDVLLNPGSLDAIANHRSTRTKQVRHIPCVFAVDRNAKRTCRGAIEPEAQRCLACGLSACGHLETNRPRTGSALIPTIRLEVSIVRHLIDKPIFRRVGLANREVDVVGKELRVFDIHSPVPMIIAFEELPGGAIRRANLPDLLTVVRRMPLNSAEIQLLPRRNGHVRGRVISAENSIRNGVKLICSRAHIRNSKAAIIGTMRPKLVVLGIVLSCDRLWRKTKSTNACRSRWDISAAVDALTLCIPLRRMIRIAPRGWCTGTRISLERSGPGTRRGNRRFGARCGARLRSRWSWGTRHSGLIRERKPYKQVRELRCRCLRIDQFETAFHGRPLIGRRVINAFDP